MTEVTFEGYLIIPNTDVKPVEVEPNVGDRTYQIADKDIVIHSIYVSNPNPVAAKLTLKALILQPGKTLEFKGVFGNETSSIAFHPPIGVFKQGKIVISVEAPGADSPIHVNIQYSIVKQT